MISARARALVEALDEQGWKGPGTLDVDAKLEIAQRFLDEERGAAWADADWRRQPASGELLDLIGCDITPAPTEGE